MSFTPERIQSQRTLMTGLNAQSVEQDMVFKFCKTCLDMRQFLPNGYSDEPKKCDVCHREL